MTTKTDDVNINNQDSDDINKNKILNDLLSSIMSQKNNDSSQKNFDRSQKNIERPQEDDEEQEDEDEEDEEDEEDGVEEEEGFNDEPDDLRWVSLDKLLASHLNITKIFLHLVKEN